LEAIESTKFVNHIILNVSTIGSLTVLEQIVVGFGRDRGPRHRCGDNGLLSGGRVGQVVIYLTNLVDSIASNSLVAVKPNDRSPYLRDILIRVALSKDTPSSAAVLRSLLALSSLHRHGFQSHATRLKLSALSALAASAKTGLNTHEVIPHVATLMLLCCFEVRIPATVRVHGSNFSLQIQHASETSSQWLSYISSVKTVLRAAHLGIVERDSDLSALLYWVEYHDVLARFSLRYWRHPAEGTLPGDPNIIAQQISIHKVYEVCFLVDNRRYGFTYDSK